MEKLVLIDGFSILNRAFYGVPPLNNSAGLHTNAVYGFLNIMFKILDEEKADYMAVAFDLPAPTFRHLEYAEYKGTRKSMPEELLEQVPLLKEVLSAMQISIITKEGFEADDIMGTIAKKYASKELFVSIVSGDRDLLQLSDTYIKVRIPKTSKGQTTIYDYMPENVVEEYGVTPLEFIDIKALMGDASDNIPGVPSIGEKTATAIIKEYHSIENAYAHALQLKPPRASKAMAEHYDKAVFSKFLVTIRLDVELSQSLEDMKLGQIYTKESLDYIKKLEFKSFEKRYTTDMAADSASAEVSYKEILTDAESDKLLASVLKKKVIGLEILSDVEETPFGDKVDILYGISLCISEKEAYIIRLEDEKLRDIIVRIFDFAKKVYVIDLKSILTLVDISERDNIWDLSVGAYVLNPLKDSYSPEDIARDYIGIHMASKESLLSKENPAKALLSDKVNAKLYLASLSWIAYNAGSRLEEALKEKGVYELYQNIEMPLIYSLVKMEKAGIGVDRWRLSEYGKNLEKDIAEIEKEIYADTGREFNINSPKQLGEILFEDMKIPGGKKTKTGYSTSADILEKLAPEYPIVNKILEYRKLTKLNSTYAVGLSHYIESDERIHGTFNQTITATGRISSTEPNLQNIPIRTEIGSKLRDIFVAKEGYVFVDADYSQIELRILASMSGDENLIESYKSALDIHAITASKVFGVPLEEVTPTLRRNAKAVNFGVVYGISAFSLSEDLSITRREALEYINNYFKTYPKVKAFLDNQVQFAKENGFVKTLYGRIRPIPEISSSNFNLRMFGDRVAMNSPIQGTAADIMKLAMVEVDRKLVEYGYDARIVLQVHDELLVEVKEEDAEAVRELMISTMKNVANLSVSLEVDAHIGKTWLSAKD